MLNKKESALIIVTTIILSFLITLQESFRIFLYVLLSVFCIQLINITTKKIIAFYLDSEIEIKLWEFQRYGFKPHKEFAKSFPAGAFVPFLSKIVLFPLNNFIWMASLIFEVKAKIYRSAKRYGLYTFSEVSEYHIGLIAASGIIANLIFAGIGYLINLPEEMKFVQLSIFYVFFNLIPLSKLDGNKIFFGSLVLWCFISSIVLISLLTLIMII